MTATWTANRTWTTGELVTAAVLNTYVRDNLDWLKTPTASNVAPFATTFTTTSTTFTDVTSMTATITTNGGGVDVYTRFTSSNSGTADTAYDIVLDGVSESGTTHGLYRHGSPGAAASVGVAFMHHIDTLSAGSHTIKLQVRTISGTQSIFGTTASFYPMFYVVESGS